MHDAGTQDHVRTIQHQLAFRSEPYSLTFIAASPYTLHTGTLQRHAGKYAYIITTTCLVACMVAYCYHPATRYSLLHMLGFRLHSPLSGQPKDQDLLSRQDVRPSMAWVDAVEDKLMRWFDIDKYVILEPNSYSRRILNDQVPCGGIPDMHA